MAPSIIAVGAGGSRSQEWLLCARVLWNRLHHPQPVRAPSANDPVAQKQCAALPITRLRGYLEQSVRVGGYSRLSRN